MCKKQACFLEKWIPQRKEWSPIPMSEKKPRKKSTKSTHMIGEVKDTKTMGNTATLEVTISEK